VRIAASVPDENKKQNKTGSDPSQGAQEDPFAARGVVVGVRPSDHMLVKVAATRIREAGVDGVGVADLMKAAGLTHGGFYLHFTSRDELVAEAIERELDDGSARSRTASTRLETRISRRSIR
jgi:hypothetical protein